MKIEEDTIEIRKINTGEIEISFQENTEKRTFHRNVLIPKNRFKDLIRAMKDKRF